MKQLSFASKAFAKSCKVFGGLHLVGKRKSKRPLSTKQAIHLVIKSDRAVSDLSFLKNKKAIAPLLKHYAHRFGVKIYQVGWGGNHIHLLIKIGHRKSYVSFIRAVTSQIVLRICHGAKAISSPQGERFFKLRPFTRILEWGRDFKGAMAYVVRNTLEAIGFIEYKPRVASNETKKTLKRIHRLQV